MIETTINELTAAIRSLTEVLKNQNATVTSFTAPPQSEVTITYDVKEQEAAKTAMEKLEAVKAKAKAKAKQNEEEAAKPAPAPEPTPAPVPEPAPAAPVATMIDIADLTMLAQKVLEFPTGLDRLRGMNARHQIERISKCPPDKVAKVYAEIQALVAELSK